jgi:hypothetical protein
VLAAALAADAATERTWVDRLCESTGARLLWAATLAALLLGHVLATSASPIRGLGTEAGTRASAVLAALDLPAELFRTPTVPFRLSSSLSDQRSRGTLGGRIDAALEEVEP